MSNNLVTCQFFSVALPDEKHNFYEQGEFLIAKDLPIQAVLANKHYIINGSLFSVLDTCIDVDSSALRLFVREGASSFRIVATTIVPAPSE
jgi:hypothetical protein